MSGRTISRKSSSSASLPTLEPQKVEASRMDNIASKAHMSKKLDALIGNKFDNGTQSYQESNRKVHDNVHDKRNDTTDVYSNYQKRISYLQEKCNGLERPNSLTFDVIGTESCNHPFYITKEEGNTTTLRVEESKDYGLDLPNGKTKNKESKRVSQSGQLDSYFIRELGIESLNASQLESMFRWYFSEPLPPTDTMFPWLHGLHFQNFSQRLFFVNSSGGIDSKHVQECKPDSRFLMCIISSPPEDLVDVIFKNTVQTKEILHPIDISRTEFDNLIDTMITELYPEELATVRDRLKMVLSEDCFRIKHLPTFVNLDPAKGVSLRNFHIQVAKSATCADFITYCMCEAHQVGECLCRSTARVIWHAQRYQAFRESQSLDKYKVYLFADYSFMSKILRKENTYEIYQDLLTFSEKEVGGDGLINEKSGFDISSLESLRSWDSNYKLKEKLETLLMSSATSVGRNVWVGNQWDFDIMLIYLLKFLGIMNLNSGTKEDERGIYYSPHNSLVSMDIDRYDKISSLLSKPKTNWRLLVHCHSDARLPDMNVLTSLLKLYSGDTKGIKESAYNYIEFFQSGSMGIGDCRPDTLMIILNTCKLIHIASQNNEDSDFTWSALIYCSDGYTESSLLVFCYLIYSRNIRLEEAIIQLHLEYRRPFYLFESDVSFLKKLEVMLMKHSPLAKKVFWNEPEIVHTSELSHLLYRGRGFTLSGFSDDSCSESDAVFESMTESESSSEEKLYEEIFSSDWVRNVEGCLPSLILPYLYLGSLKQANSLTLLSKLGISKIVSVGENLTWLDSYNFRKIYRVNVTSVSNGDLEIYNITRASHRFTPCCVDTVIKINNLLDDGIHGLSSSLENVLEYFENEYHSSSGRTKFLVHCRVGVSRSATVVIAEVMKRLKISLPKAYLYVRVRRLNIIIQPNLRFVYELFKWEEKQRKKVESEDQKQEGLAVLREIDWFIMCREILNLNLSYIK